MRTAGSRRLGLLAITAGVLTSLLVPARASAGVTKAGGISYVTKSGLNLGANVVKTFKAPCPQATHVLGGGFFQNGGFVEHVVATHSYPYDGGDQGSAFDDGWAVELDSSDSAVSVTTYAICAPISPTYRQSPVMLVYYQIDPPLLAMRLCPSGTYATSGGTTGPAGLYETSSYPFADRWYSVTLFNSIPAGQITIRAICIKREVHSIDTGYDAAVAESQTNVITRCPTSAPHVVGAGISTFPSDYEEGSMTIASMNPVYYNSGDRDGWQGRVDNTAISEDAGGLSVRPSCIASL
jgi:hypothetical protein